VADNVTTEVRSRVMSRIRAKNTSPELILRRALWSAGLRGWRNHMRNLTGNPDIVFSKQRLAIFVDGCFWHGCPKCYRKPHTNKKYWVAKLKRNVGRDRRTAIELTSKGWIVLRFWEHVVRKDAARCSTIILHRLYLQSAGSSCSGPRATSQATRSTGKGHAQMNT
jgi:DNA mismatch endonuclease Vsr